MLRKSNFSDDVRLNARVCGLRGEPQKKERPRGPLQIAFNSFCLIGLRRWHHFWDSLVHAIGWRMLGRI